MIDLKSFERALPTGFPFYNLGHVTTAAPGQETVLCPEDSTSISFRIFSDENQVARVVLIFGKDLDTSTYAEIGNIIAAKVANVLDLLISPPEPLKPSQLERLLEISTMMIIRQYSHQVADASIPFTALLMPFTEGRVGHA